MGGGIQWTPAMEQALLDGLLVQHRKGKRADGGWKSEAWQAILPVVQAKVTQKSPQGVPMKISKAQLSNKTTDLKQTYAAWKACFNLSGFGWNEETELFTAEDEVWESYIQVSICSIDGAILTR